MWGNENRISVGGKIHDFRLNLPSFFSGAPIDGAPIDARGRCFHVSVARWRHGPHCNLMYLDSPTNYIRYECVYYIEPKGGFHTPPTHIHISIYTGRKLDASKLSKVQPRLDVCGGHLRDAIGGVQL